MCFKTNDSSVRELLKRSLLTENENDSINLQSICWVLLKYDFRKRQLPGRK